MERGQFGPVLHQLRHLFEGRSIAGVSEWQLLHRYLDRRDEVAFEAIVSRHGPMVLGVCRRMLADARDVEDVPSRPRSWSWGQEGQDAWRGRPRSVTGLYGVAYRVAAPGQWPRLLVDGGSRDRPRPLEFARTDGPASRDVAEVIDEELARLPAKYRSPVVLCYLEGRTHEEAARQLGWPLGTVKGRLARARDLLKGRLSRRGVAPSGLFALARGSRVAVPRPLLEITVRAAEAGRSAGVVPAAVASLGAGSLSTMFMNKLKAAGMVVLVLGTGAAVLAYQGSREVGPAPGQGPARRASNSAKMVASNPSMSSGDVADWGHRRLART